LVRIDRTFNKPALGITRTFYKIAGRSHPFCQTL